MPSCIIVIPARLASTRLPRKMLLSDTGKPLIQHTFEAARRATLADKVIVATDHESILQAVESFGGEAMMTDPQAPSGTDRVAEVSRRYPEFDLVVNVQGDEPEIEANAIDNAIRLLREDPQAVMSTLATPIRDKKILDDPAAVKVVFDRRQNALYFSRSPIPHPREWSDDLLVQDPALFHLHVGLYAYRNDFLQTISSLQRSSLETTENLEQLRVLDHGHKIKVAVLPSSQPGIDTPEDYQAFVKRQEAFVRSQTK